MSNSYFFKDIHLLTESIIGTIFIISFIILCVRTFGLKSFAKMSGHDFVITILIGNVAAMTICTGRPGLVVGCLIILTVFIIKHILAYLIYHNKQFENLIANEPLLLVSQGRFIENNMKKAKVSRNEILGKLREANVLSLADARAVILETTGDVSVMHTKTASELESEILEDVKA